MIPNCFCDTLSLGLYHDPSCHIPNKLKLNNIYSNVWQNSNTLLVTTVKYLIEVFMVLHLPSTIEILSQCF